jgi:hypothetical protein
LVLGRPKKPILKRAISKFGEALKKLADRREKEK